MSSEVKHYDLKISGRVQGVGYRAFAKRTAIQLGLRGFVKNMMDGTVYIEVEGDKDTLDRYVIQCRKGPGWAHVDNVKVTESPYQSFEDFRVSF